MILSSVCLTLCADYRSSMPLHTLQTDMVETCGGLNQTCPKPFGSSLIHGIHHHYVQYTVTKQLPKKFLTNQKKIKIPSLQSCTQCFHNSQCRQLRLQTATWHCMYTAEINLKAGMVLQCNWFNPSYIRC